MGDTTGIAWTDYTLNHWIGCTKVGPGCDGCYAEARDQRFDGGVHWGVGAPRRRTSEHTRNRPLKWNRDVASTGRRWVFASSLCDVFDNEVDPQWRAELFKLIEVCRNLRFQLTTKRVGLVLKMLPSPVWLRNNPHVGVLATMVNQKEFDRDSLKLHDVKDAGAKWVGLSVEPQIGFIDLGGADWLDWVICGGESDQVGHEARDFHLNWARDLSYQCKRLDIPFFMKQVGSRPIDGFGELPCRDRAGADPREWPMEIRIREMPRVYDGAP